MGEVLVVLRGCAHEAGGLAGRHDEYGISRGRLKACRLFYAKGEVMTRRR